MECPTKKLGKGNERGVLVRKNFYEYEARQRDHRPAEEVRLASTEGLGVRDQEGPLCSGDGTQEDLV